MYELVNNKKIYNKIFHINFPYFLDQDFARIASQAIKTKKSNKIIKIECRGNKHQESPQQAKRMYITQAINLICSMCSFLNISKFDKFIVHDEYNGEVTAGDMQFLFSWAYAERPELNFSYRTQDAFEEKTIVYDEYDQIMPLLMMMSEKIHSQLPVGMSSIPEHLGSIEEINSKIVSTMYLVESSAENFATIFSNYSGSKIEETNPANLFFNGGFVG